MSLYRGHNHFEFDYVLHDVCLLRVTIIKDLGVVYDSSFSFVDHIQQVTAKALMNAWLYSACDY